MKDLESVQEMIKVECDEIKALLLEKNMKYGNSALEPKRIFSSSNAVEQLLVRIDDKLSRIQTVGFDKDGNCLDSDKNSESTSDTIQDLIGYLVLLRVANKISVKKNKSW